jgi:pyridoxamine 5'-phosphate oxidase
MITFINNSNEEPYKLFYKHYNEAFSLNQNNIEAASISTFNPKFNEVSSRLVNIKYIDNNKLTFFTNYNSRKGIHS